jgi:hypothetical protein
MAAPLCIAVSIPPMISKMLQQYWILPNVWSWCDVEVDSWVSIWPLEAGAILKKFFSTAILGVHLACSKI